MAYDIYMHTFFSKKPNAKLKDILTEAEKSAIQVGEAKTSNGEYPFFTSGATILKWNEPFVDGRNCFLNTGGSYRVQQSDFSLRLSFLPKFQVFRKSQKVALYTEFLCPHG